jgi:hypothetical protein
MIKIRTHSGTSNNDERRQFLPLWIIWVGNMDFFKEFSKIKVHYGQIGAGYLFDLDFQEDSLKKIIDCYIDFFDEVPSTSQVKKDSRALYGTLLIACQCWMGRRTLVENISKQGGIRSWRQSVKQYETNGSKNVRIKKLKKFIATVFHRNYKGVLAK